MLKNRSLALQLTALIVTGTAIIFLATVAYNYYASKKTS